jgi:hypothetical protein
MKTCTQIARIQVENPQNKSTKQKLKMRFLKTLLEILPWQHKIAKHYSH